MRCTRPLKCGFLADGKTISFSEKNSSKEYDSFLLPCGRCINCRLDYARSWAIRSYHESQMHENNIFLTLTYSDENLKSDKLIYSDFQNFMKALRHKVFNDYLKSNHPSIIWSSLTNIEKIEFKQEHKESINAAKISVFVTGEYGTKNKRPHWHAIIFNYRPKDEKYKYTNELGDKLYDSETISKLWTHGTHDFGQVTLKSAGYVARYAAKKLAHGRDQDHDYTPISKKSSHQAIGKRWLEKHWPDVFNYGAIILPDGTQASIPRYYEKWLKLNHPDAWHKYATEIKPYVSEFAKQKILPDQIRSFNRPLSLTRNQVREILTQSKFKLLQENLKF